MTRNMVSEVIDPNDRRRRKLVLTEKGMEERKWQVKEVRKIIEDVKSWDQKAKSSGQSTDPDLEFERMKYANVHRPKLVGRKRKKRRAAA
jgi:hypothetical protein